MISFFSWRIRTKKNTNRFFKKQVKINSDFTHYTKNQ